MPDFRATLRMLDFGTVQAHTMSLPALESDRSSKLIRQSDPEQYQLGLPLRGDYRFAQAGRDITIGAGDLVLVDSSRPFRSLTVPDESDTAELLMIQFSKTLLPLRSGAVDQLISVQLPGREGGIGALLSSYLRELTKGAAQYRAADASRLATITLDLLSTLLAHELNTGSSLPPETHYGALLTRIYDFINQHLGDTALSPDMISGAHHISNRSLHRLFHGQGLTVAGWIRTRRVERCRCDLVDPLLQDQPIHAIAARWGFTNAAHFSRLFRASYGHSPRDYQHRHMARVVNNPALMSNAGGTSLRHTGQGAEDERGGLCGLGRDNA